MNLSALMNDGPEPATEKKQSPDAHRSYQPPPPPPPLVTDAQPSTPSSYGPASRLRTPLYPPPSAGEARPLQSRGLTPLQTPSQVLGGAQYPFPSQMVQSPAGLPTGQQYRPYEVYSATTPGGRPPSHGVSYPQPSPSQHPPSGLPQAMHAHPSSSLSPTPSSHHSQTPHSVRQSPLSAMPHPPSQQHPQHQHQHSQPSTPLGPPPLYHQRSSHYADLHSPFHQRTLSNTSNGITSGSPAQHHPSIGNLVESPNAYNRPSPHLRRTSEYLGHVERERSVSVSPKTKVPPRPPSFGSRPSSQQETYPSRSSVQTNVAHLSGSPNHVTQTQSHAVAQHESPPYSQLPSAGSEVSQLTPSVLQAPNSAFVAPGGPLSQASNQAVIPTQGIQHQSQKMGMNHLITPASEVPPSVNGIFSSGSEALMPPKQKEGASIFMKQKKSPAPKKPVVSPPPPAEQHDVKSGDAVPPRQTPPQPHLEQQLSHAASAVKHESLADATADSIESKRSLKRPAESDDLATGPPTKLRRTMRKYAERPTWARLSRVNPKFNQQDKQNGVVRPPQNPPQKPPQSNQHVYAPAQPNGPSLQQPNGQTGGVAMDGRPPWLQNPPLDFDLIQSQQVLGKWEKTFKWNTPYPDMLRVVQDWLFMELDQLGDVGTDPREGTIEIEAKIGTLLQSGSDERCRLPVASATVLRPEENHRYHFESRMDEAEHKAMNEFMNGTIRESYQKGRVNLSYVHLRETDSFHKLSPAGFDALPTVIKKRMQKRHEPRIRTTTNKQDGKVLARIVKINLSNLHIFNPVWNYDCRISINLEVNLDRPDLDLNDLIEAPSAQQHPMPDREKDRMAYKHLVYSIDLTKVHTAGLSLYELELEVDSGALRQQMRLMKEGRPHAFGDVVSGFLDNATFLMRQRPT